MEDITSEQVRELLLASSKIDSLKKEDRLKSYNTIQSNAAFRRTDRLQKPVGL